MKPRNYRCHSLNRNLGRARIARGVSKQNSQIVSNAKKISMRFFVLVVFHLPHASYTYKTIGYVTDVKEISC